MAEEKTDGVKIVLIEWWDAESFADGSWTALSEIEEWAKKPFPLVRTVGELIHETGGWAVVLASRSVSRDEDDSPAGYHAMKIPKLWIKRMETLYTEDAA
jgi:hypothetical protein